MSNQLYELQSEHLEYLNVELLYICTAPYGEKVTKYEDATRLYYLTDGIGKIEVNGKTSNVCLNDLVIVNSHSGDVKFRSTGYPFQYIELGIHGLDFMFEKSGSTEYSILNTDSNSDDFSSYMKTILTEVQQKSEGYKNVCQAVVNMLIYKIMRNTNCSVFSTSKKTSKDCAKIKQYIDQNFTEKISLDSLAEMTKINKYYLIHIFHEETGLSPISYLIQKRIEKSKYLLRSTDYSLSYIARASGFSSQSYFSQVFKKNVQMSPLEYRSKYTK